MTKPLLVKVGALCVKEGGAHFDPPPLFGVTSEGLEPSAH